MSPLSHRGRWFVPALAFLLSIAPSTAGRAHAQSDAAAESSLVARAQNAYDEARFTDAIDLLRPAVDGGRLSLTGVLRARELLGRCYVKTGQTDMARTEFKAILDQDPSYRLDPDRVPPEQVREFEIAQKEWKQARAKAEAPTRPWKGLFVSGNLGYDWGSSDVKTSTVFDPAGYFALSSAASIDTFGVGTVSPEGVGGGLSVGYNHQRGPLVLGAVVTLNAAGHEDSRSVTQFYPDFRPSTYTIDQTTEMGPVVLLLARLGYARGGYLGYGLVGMGNTSVKLDDSFHDTFGTGATQAGSKEESKTSLALGLGVEKIVRGPWSVSLEYQHLDFGTVTVQGEDLVSGGTAFPTNVFTQTTTLELSSVRLQVNYKVWGGD